MAVTPLPTNMSEEVISDDKAILFSRTAPTLVWAFIPINITITPKANNADFTLILDTPTLLIIIPNVPWNIQTWKSGNKKASDKNDKPLSLLTDYCNYACFGMKIESDVMNFTKMFKSYAGKIENTKNKKIIVSGMGGSGISGDIASALCDAEAPAQVVTWKNYGLPEWVTKQDYVICISYSGNTEETLSAAKRAMEIGCELYAITTGGKLKKEVTKYGGEVTVVETGHQPRAALPLLLVPLLEKIGIDNLDEQIEEVRNITFELKKAKHIAKKMHGKLPCIYSSSSLECISYRWRCQIEENAKQMAFNHSLPEMNHNEIVGWTLPNDDLIVVTLRDSKESSVMKKRFENTINLAWKEKNVDIIEITASGKHLLARMMYLTVLGDLVSIELAKLNAVDPTPVEIIEKLKIELSK